MKVGKKKVGSLAVSAIKDCKCSATPSSDSKRVSKGKKCKFNTDKFARGDTVFQSTDKCFELQCQKLKGKKSYIKAVNIKCDACPGK